MPGGERVLAGLLSRASRLESRGVLHRKFERVFGVWRFANPPYVMVPLLARVRATTAGPCRPMAGPAGLDRAGGLHGMAADRHQFRQAVQVQQGDLLALHLDQLACAQT